MPAFSSYLIASLERRFLPIPVAESPSSDAIVILGGCVGAADYPRLEVDLTDAADGSSMPPGSIGQGKRLWLSSPEVLSNGWAPKCLKHIPWLKISVRIGNTMIWKDPMTINS